MFVIEIHKSRRLKQLNRGCYDRTLKFFNLVFKKYRKFKFKFKFNYKIKIQTTMTNIGKITMTKIGKTSVKHRRDRGNRKVFIDEKSFESLV